MAGSPRLLVALFLALLVPAALHASRIRRADRAEQGLPPEHPFQRIFTILGEQFPASAEQPMLTVPAPGGRAARRGALPLGRPGRIYVYRNLLIAGARSP